MGVGRARVRRWARLVSLLALSTPWLAGCGSPFLEEQLSARAPQRNAIAVVSPSLDQTLYLGTRYDIAINVGTVTEATASAPDSDLKCDYARAKGVLYCAMTASAAKMTVTVSTKIDGGDPQTRAIDFSFTDPKGFYPRGDKFTMGLYGTLPKDFSMIKDNAFGLVQSYGPTTEDEHLAWLKQVEAAGLTDMTMLHWQDELDSEGYPVDTEKTKQYLAHLSQQAGVGWWALPEEQRYWISAEFRTVTRMYRLIREADNASHPIFMYIPGSFLASDIAYYVPYLDLIGTGAYVEYSGQPHSWFRWRIESQIDAIQQAGYTTDVKTPIAIPGYFPNPPDQPQPTAEGLYHDIFSGLASGARAVVVFSYAYSLENSDALKKLLDAAKIIVGEERVGEWILKGKRKDALTLEVLDGPKNAPSFTPIYLDKEITYPSIHAVAWDHAGTRIVIAVNSSTESVRARVGGLGPGSTKGAVLGEARDIDVQAGALEDTFAPLGVHVYRFRLLDLDASAL